jgi:hypothetical protein
MPAAVIATVVRWEVDWSQTPPVTCLCDSKSISLVLADGAGSDLAPVVAQYILDAASKGQDGTVDASICEQLLKATRDGLVQVVPQQRVQFATPPMIPRRKPETAPGHAGTGATEPRAS